MTTSTVDHPAVSREVSFLGSLLKINSLGTNRQAHRIFKHPTALGNNSDETPAPPTATQDPSDVIDRSAKKGLSSATTRISPAPVAAELPMSSKNNVNPNKPKHSHPSEDRKRHVRKAPDPRDHKPSPRTPRESMPDPVKDQCSPNMARSSSNYRCSCNLKPADELELASRPPNRSKLIANLYYVRPPTLVEYRRADVPTTAVACAQIADELIDLTQSTISMVQSLKREHRH